MSVAIVTLGRESAQLGYGIIYKKILWRWTPDE